MLKLVDDIMGVNFSNSYFNLILVTILTLLLRKVVLYFIQKIVVRIDNNKLQFKLLQFLKVVVNLSEVLVLYLLWEKNIKNIVTIISLVSAAITLSLKDFIFNFFASLYIKFSQVFKVEDRIEINGYKGDVVNIGAFSFELLEISEEYGNQSTGIILTLPSSIIFSYPLKNLNKGFKYIWNEMDICIRLDSDVEMAKSVIYKIINNIDILKKIPNSMQREIKNNTTYRMYFNKYSPIIYTDVKDKHIILELRYLVDPKKARVVNSMIWNNLLEEYRNGNINLVNEE